MLHNSRKAALAAGQKTYHTGVPCRNGHTTYRYTSSSTCSGCLRSAEAGFKTSGGTNLRAKFYEESTPVYIFLPPADKELMKEALRQLNDVRWPGVVSVFILKKPPVGGLAKYEVRAHPQDAQTVRDIADAFCKPYQASGKAAAAAIHAALNPAPSPIIPRA